MQAKKFLLLLGIFLLLIILGSHMVSQKVEDREEIDERVDDTVTTEELPELDDETFLDTSDEIRVVLNTEGYQSLYHKQVQLTCTSDFEVSAGDSVKKYKAGRKLTYDKVDDKTIIKPLEEKGRVKILSYKRSSGNPEYRGVVEISSHKNGLILVNELSLEEYLYGVVPSEMPVSFGHEALKVQAVCARSYAVRQKNAGRYKEYGADVDDSVNCQVYKNTIEDGRSNKAVRDTKGQVITYKGEIIVAYFFSTSSGYTTNANHVWYQNEKEKKAEIPYLLGCFQGDKNKTYQLKNEKVFRKFIDQGDQFATFEQDEDWYRWTIDTNLDNLTKSIAAASDEYQIGRLKNITIKERGEGGVANVVELKGENGTVLVEKEYQIRLALAPLNDSIQCQNDKVINNMALLPSGYFYVDIEEDKVKIVGGGYGHGVGMSQNGAKNMAAKGYQMEEIINHYFQDTKLEVLY